ncbi:MAG TPA: division/cell wall cluster transcriptional repressor MraZ [Candidatus Limnocylindria bacterium]|nr:division/cell wall cluster transcriptional repressor MraZ [Candidatus Limnocylindria bacterium]
MFTGEYRHAIDDKGRIAVPARFRADLAGGAFVSRWIDNCLAIFPRQAWDDLAARVASLPYTDAGARTFSRFLFSGAYEFEPDRQGRVLLPAGLREQAGLGSEAVVVGARDHIELWEPARWADYSEAMNSPDELARHLEGLGI